MTRRGDIRDIKHVVILMQENRSFDHYFGSLRGVRGFGDRATILLPGGLPVWRQPDASHLAVYDNLAAAPALADYPAGFPG